MISLVVDLEKLELTSSNNVVGPVFFRIGTEAFPEEGWWDFPVVIIAWWINHSARLLDSAREVTFQFMDGSPFIDRTHVEGLYFNGGWCYGGFKATPASGWCYAHLLARDEPHPVATELRLDRFRRGHMIDEKGAGAQPNLH